MERDGTGVIGLKHAYSAANNARGAIAWHVARLYRNEAGALQVDSTLARSTAPSPINESDGTKGVSFKLERRQLCHPSRRTAGRKTCRVARATELDATRLAVD